VRQAGAPPTGKWQGSAAGGVKAPQPVLLPDPARRFAATAARMEALAPHAATANWLRFMAHLARAQHAAAAAMVHLPALDAGAVEQSVANRMPPLAAETHERDPIWREGLQALLGSLAANASLPRLDPSVGQLQAAEAAAIEALASGFLQTGIDADDAAKTLYIAAALQVYFTLLASTLRADQLRLLPKRALCPCCGSTPVAGVIAATGDTPGVRYLYCSLCSTAWIHVRAVCITCGGSAKVELRNIEGAEAVKAETCGECRTYAKVLYQAKDMQLDPFADDLATLGLDVLLAEAGWARHAPNPLVLVGAD
jgi:FdhE protein